MRLSDIIVLPSLHEEQYGRVIQEAVACGNVAVGSNIGAIPEIIKDKHLLFNPEILTTALILKGYLMKLLYEKIKKSKN